MYQITSLILSLAALASSVFGFNCSIPPVYVDIHKRAVSGTDVFQYGSFIGVGTPAQNQSLLPSLRQDETSVASSDFCRRNNSLADCDHSTRGFFDSSQSITWTLDNTYVSTDGTNSTIQGFFGEDNLHLYTHFFESDPATEKLLSNFTVEVANKSDVSPGVLGLGLSSTVLQKLFADGLIAGRTFSLYLGSGMDRAGGVINGSNTFGGYDAGRFTGPVYNYSMNMSDPEPLALTVMDISLNDPTGLVRNVSLFDTDPGLSNNSRRPPFTARMSSDQYPFSFPFEITQAFRTALAADDSDSSDRSLRLTKPYNGTMVLTMSDGAGSIFNVTIPADVMFNASGISPVAARSQSSKSPFYLGQAFLSQVYLMLDYEAHTFHLAQAIAEPQFVSLQTFCPKTVPQPYSAPDTGGFAKAGLIGALVGGIGAGLAMTALTTWLFLAWRKGRREKAAEMETVHGKSKAATFDHFEFGLLPVKAQQQRRGVLGFPIRKKS